MKLIKEKFLFFFNKIKQSYFDYRVTMVSVAVATLYVAFCDILDSIDLTEDSFMHHFIRSEGDALRLLLLFTLAAMFTESVLYYEKKERRIEIIRILCFIFSAVTAAAFIAVQNIVAINQDIRNTYSMTKSGYVIAEWKRGFLIQDWAMRWYIACILLLLLGIIFFSHKKSGVGFIEYMMHVGVNFCVVTAVYIVLCIGVTLVLTVLVLLLFEDAEILIGLSLIFLTGIYYIPACIMSLGNMDSNIDDGVSRVLTKYVLTGMTICAMAIVYVYLLKILITWEMPSNEIFGIVSGLFCIGMLIWVVDYYYRDDTKYAIFLQRVPYGMIPMIPVQAYAMCVRIYNNGMTPARYVGILLIIFEIIMLFIWRFWREKMERVTVVLCALVFVAICMPGVNMFSISNRWQQAFLVSGYNKVMSGQEITQKEYDRMVGAHRYLRWQTETEDVTKQYNINADDFAQMLVISDLNTENITNLESHYLHCCQLVDTIDVGEYSRMDMVNQDPLYKASGYGSKGDGPAVDFSAFRFYKRSGSEEEMFEVDISDFADKCFVYENEHPDATQEEISDAMRPYQIIVIDDSKVLYLNHFELRYTDGVKDGEEYFDWSTVNVSGILFSL